MTAVNFCFWLQGFFELQEAGTSKKDNVNCGLFHERVECIKKHLALVFANDIDPSFKNAEALNAIHNPNGEARPRC